jgi:hypothetical protein
MPVLGPRGKVGVALIAGYLVGAPLVATSHALDHLEQGRNRVVWQSILGFAFVMVCTGAFLVLTDQVQPPSAPKKGVK